MLRVVAILDDRMTLRGFREVERVADGDVEVPVGCDLATDGRYIWDAAAQTFHPIAPVRQGSAPADTMADALLAIRDSMQVTFPESVLGWLKMVEQSRGLPPTRGPRKRKGR